MKEWERLAQTEGRTQATFAAWLRDAGASEELIAVTHLEPECRCGHYRSDHQRWTPNLVSGLTEIKYTSCLECDCEEYR